ncbi:winged helix-turn-helix transcriptional regulator [Paenibacillus radicis (ex Gao et al. 2016)]|uniref:Sensory transduction protein n=1 Tax=Paenibacillus radicis (ex Gao et al. 2016) TaxID=1737354 RepID=A0A917M359_9BACL|nr:response regulator transcription factor [Paenibacillus radicis (ex Gao et al. 2016)]GGG73998.1 putative sensory transduction protein [Paenibacillus radicis (ex Gao et al. 2016)]
MRQPINAGGEFSEQADVMNGQAPSYASEEDVLPGGQMACSLTKRVMAVSPFPERMHNLLRLLAADCFDLFTLHDLNKAFVSSLQPELILFDATPHPLLNPDAVDALRAGLNQTAHLHGIPLLFLIGEQAKVASHSLPEGAELLVWPGEPMAALRRINRILQQRTPSGGSILESSYNFKDLSIDLKKMIVYRGEKRIDLTKTEYELLLMFVTSDGGVISREAMFNAIWGSQFLGGSNVVDVHIKSLRKKLGDSAAAPLYIVTVRGAGYRLAEG